VIVKLSNDDLQDVLRDVAAYRPQQKSWLFSHPDDSDFIARCGCRPCLANLSTTILGTPTLSSGSRLSGTPSTRRCATSWASKVSGGKRWLGRARLAVAQEGRLRRPGRAAGPARGARRSRHRRWTTKSRRPLRPATQP